MIVFAIAIVFIVVAVLALMLQKTYFYLPYKELKRQAAHGDHLASSLFRATAYGTDLKVLLWFVTGLSSALGFVLFARVAPPVFGVVVVSLTLWLAFLWLPRTRLTPVGAQMAVWCTPLIVQCLRFIHPILRSVLQYGRRYMAGPHTGMYEREDIYELIEQQRQQGDNRISDHELELIRNVLQFGDYEVRDAMVARKRVKAVDMHESIGPVLLDELHNTGHTRFPVYDAKPNNIVGVLSIQDVGDIKQHARVRDHYDKRLAYVHEADSLAQTVRAFYETKQHLFVVVNNFNEYVGIITIEDVLRRLVGAADHNTAGQHDDRKAVAARHDRKEETKSSEEAE
jgi:putative hemolysin